MGETIDLDAKASFLAKVARSNIELSMPEFVFLVKEIRDLDAAIQAGLVARKELLKSLGIDTVGIHVESPYKKALEQVKLAKTTLQTDTVFSSLRRFDIKV